MTIILYSMLTDEWEQHIFLVFYTYQSLPAFVTECEIAHLGMLAAISVWTNFLLCIYSMCKYTKCIRVWTRQLSWDFGCFILPPLHWPSTVFRAFGDFQDSVVTCSQKAESAKLSLLVSSCMSHWKPGQRCLISEMIPASSLFYYSLPRYIPMSLSVRSPDPLWLFAGHRKQRWKGGGGKILSAIVICL